MARRLILLRHGQTEYNATGRMQGQLDTKLSENGRKQAEFTAKQLAGWDIRRVLSSDLSRASDTAEIIAREHGLTPVLDSRLRETHLGKWQAKSHQEIDASHPGQRAMWRHNPRWAPPEGEARTDVAARTRAVIDELMVDFPEWEDGIVLVVAHGGAIASLTAALLEIPVDHYPVLSGLGNTSWAQLTARPRFLYDPAVGGEEKFAQAMETTPVLRFTPETVGNAQWYLDAWNASAIGIPFAPAEQSSANGISVTYSLNATEGMQ